MKLTIDDIEIFILTHNRAEYLVQSINSILNQTTSVGSITVLDNESSDNTEAVSKSFKVQGVKYFRTHGFLGNFIKAKELASKKFIMLFHDDDVLHPNYLELAIRALNQYENVSLITTRYTTFKSNGIPEISNKFSDTHYFFSSQKYFAKHMYFIEHIAYASAIYRTSDFLETPLEYEKYSKFNDWPFMVKISNKGNSILFDDPKLFYARQHDSQDSKTSVNYLSIEQIIYWDKVFYDAMNANKFFSMTGLFYRYKCLRYFMDKYMNFLPEQDREKYTFEDLKQIAKQLGLSTNGATLLNKKCIALFIKPLFKMFKRRLQTKELITGF